MPSNLQPTVHRDGTVTYWSVPDQRWVHHGYPDDREIRFYTDSARRRLLAWQKRDQQSRRSQAQWEASDRALARKHK